MTPYPAGGSDSSCNVVSNAASRALRSRLILVSRVAPSHMLYKVNAVF